MDLRNDGEVGKGTPGSPRLGQTSDPISSLNEAWFHTLDSCVVDMPLSEVVFLLSRPSRNQRGKIA